MIVVRKNKRILRQRAVLIIPFFHIQWCICALRRWRRDGSKRRKGRRQNEVERTTVSIRIVLS